MKLLVKNLCGHASRGATLVEVALSLYFVIVPMTLLITAIGWVGYNQLMIDGAAFTVAHEQSLGQSQSAAVSHAQSIFGTFVTITSPTFDKRPPVVGNLSGNPFGSSNPGQMTGGKSLVTASQTGVQISNTISSSFSPKFLSVTGFAIEPVIEEFCPHLCADSGGFSPSVLSKGINYFTQGEDSSPYYGGFQFLRTCNSLPITNFALLGTNAAPLNPPEPDLAITDYDQGRSWTTTCPNYVWRSLGKGQFLDTQNYLDSANGMYQGPGWYDVANPSWGTFFMEWYHRRIYARIALEISGIQATPTNNIVADDAQATKFLKAIFNVANPTSFPNGSNASTPDGNGIYWHEGPGEFIYHIGKNGGDSYPGWDGTDLNATPAFNGGFFEGNGDPGSGAQKYIGHPEI